ncbi:hypothetical protein ACHWQZ_G019594 [Mnemiopsis leidyi]
MIRLVVILTTCLIGASWGKLVTVTVYQSSLTYYDTVEGEGEWVDLTDAATELNFTARFDCQFVSLPFQFPYYSDKINRIGVTKLGFIYTGPYNNARLTELMHIAPLMNLYKLENGSVSYETFVDQSGTSFYVLQWSNVTVLDYSATFQLQLHQNGTIVFVYKNISEGLPERSVVSIVSSFPWITSENQSPDEWTFFEYEEIKANKKHITNGTAISFNLRQNCLAATNCTSCLDIGKSTQFSCMWCDSLQRCSDTFDSRYAQWNEKCSKPTTLYKECPANQERNETLSVLSDDMFEQQLALLNQWFESLANSTLFGSNSGTCNEGLFYNPFTQSCNDCIYCATEDCMEECATANEDDESNKNDPRKNMKIRNYKFSDVNPDGDIWKSAFIGMTSGVAVCLCFGILLVCMKRRNYVQFGGPTWAPSSTPATMSQLDEKPLIYGSSAEGYNA